MHGFLCIYTIGCCGSKESQEFYFISVYLLSIVVAFSFVRKMIFSEDNDPLQKVDFTSCHLLKQALHCKKLFFTENNEYGSIVPIIHIYIFMSELLTFYFVVQIIAAPCS